MKRLGNRFFIFVAAFGVAAALAHADSLASVARHLSKGVAQLNPKRIAVLSFPYHDGDVSSGSSLVAERLTTLLVERGEAEVVERALLDKTMAEIRLGTTGMMDPGTTQKIGKILGVTAVVTGTLVDLEENETEVNARLIRTETGEILSAGSARIKRSWNDLPRPAPSAPGTGPSELKKQSVTMSDLIPVSSPRRTMPTVYSGPITPSRNLAPGTGSDVLTLTNEDLVPLRYHGTSDPENIVQKFLSDPQAPADPSVHMARRIYHRNPDPRIRGRALLAMGRMFERTGHPDHAGQAYQQILREFSDDAALQAEARRRLTILTPSR